MISYSQYLSNHCEGLQTGSCVLVCFGPNTRQFHIVIKIMSIVYIWGLADPKGTATLRHPSDDVIIFIIVAVIWQNHCNTIIDVILVFQFQGEFQQHYNWRTAEVICSTPGCICDRAVTLESVLQTLSLSRVSLTNTRFWGHIYTFYIRSAAYSLLNVIAYDCIIIGRELMTHLRSAY